MKKLLLLAPVALFVASALFLSSCKPDAPTANFTYSTDGNTVTFTFTGDGEVDEYAWSFGDGGSSSDKNPTHEYEASGDFQVTLTVSNKGGDDAKTETITIEGSAGAEDLALSFGDADGALYAINTVTITSTGFGDVSINLGTAVAWFTDGSGFVDAGTVAWHQGSKSEDLDFSTSAKTYNWVETTQPSQGFDDSGVSWSVSGGSGVPAMMTSELTYDAPFPSISSIDESSASINGGASYTLSHKGSISDADSVFYAIYGSNGNLLKRMGPSTTSVTFSASEMGTLGSGSAIMQVAGFSVKRTEVNSKVIYMVHEAVASKTVTIE
ncbi:MAG: PKD domain-containing protein [Flavobacteriales bacterium]